MASEVLKLTAQIVISHASMTELTPKELVQELKEVYGLLASLEGELACEVAAPEPKVPAKRAYKPRTVKMAESLEAKAVENEDGPVIQDPDYLEFMESREG